VTAGEVENDPFPIEHSAPNQRKRQIGVACSGGPDKQGHGRPAARADLKRYAAGRQGNGAAA